MNHASLCDSPSPPNSPGAPLLKGFVAESKNERKPSALPFPVESGTRRDPHAAHTAFPKGFGLSNFLGWWRSHFAAATDAPVVFGEAAGLSLLSTMSLGHRWVASGSGINPNLYMMLTAGSSIARKTTAVRFARRLLDEVNPSLVGPADYTMEALYQWMTVKDEATGKGRTKFCLFSEEFGNDLARAASYNTSLYTEFNSLYDGTDIHRIRVKSSAVHVLKPRVGFLGGVAHHLLTQYCNLSHWDTGFFNRFLFVDGTAHMRPESIIQPTPPASAWATCVQAALWMYDQLKSNSYPMHLSPNAAAMFSALVQELRGDLGQREDSMAAYISRLTVNVQKMALLYQIDRDPNASVIDVDAMSDAVSFTRHLAWPSFKMIHGMTTRTDYRTALTNTQLLAARPDGVTRRELFQLYGAELMGEMPMKLIKYLSRSSLYQRGLSETGEECWRVRI